MREYNVKLVFNNIKFSKDYLVSMHHSDLYLAVTYLGKLRKL